MFQISVNCNVGVARTSCAECPNPLKPDSFGNRVCDGGNCDFAWCTGGGHCQIKRFATDGNFGGTAKLVDFCVSEYFEKIPICSDLGLLQRSYSDLHNRQAASMLA